MSSALYIAAWSALTVLLLMLQTVSTTPQSPRRNVLYIVIDDLRAEMQPYNQSFVKTPHLASLAASGIVFERAYCNQPVCSPSRNSFMTGRRPSTTKVWNFLKSFRQTGGANWTTLPGHFLEHGFATLGTGKVYHPNSPPNGDNTRSWSDLPHVQWTCNNSNAGKPGTYCLPEALGCTVKGDTFAPNPRWCSIDAHASTPSNLSSANVTWDTWFADTATLYDARMKLRWASANRKATGQPFFLAVGFIKPHLDWRVPAPFADLYPSVHGENSLPEAQHPVAQQGRPPVSIHCPFEAAAFEKRWKGWGYTDPWTPMRPESARQMRRFYYASTSWMDSLVGSLLAVLEEGGDHDDTLVVFHSDHGWGLGENADWKKFALTELGTRVPLILRAPWLPRTKGTRSSALVELVDIFPTISDLIGLPKPRIDPGDAPLDGKSFAPILTRTGSKASHTPVRGGYVSGGFMSEGYDEKRFVWQQYPRCPKNTSVSTELWRANLCIETPASHFGWMGYALRGDKFRYVAWFPWNGSTLRPVIPDTKNGTAPRNGTNGFYSELYHYGVGVDGEGDLDVIDQYEVANEHPDVVDEMYTKLLSLLG